MNNIDNPFNEQWNNFDKEKFKKDITNLLDKIINSQNNEELEQYTEKLDEKLMTLIAMVKFKGEENVKLYSFNDIPQEILKKIGITSQEIDNLPSDICITSIQLVDLLGKEILTIIDHHLETKENKDKWIL